MRQPRRVWAVALLALFFAAPAAAQTIPGFDHARPQAPGQLELGGGAAGGDELLSIFGFGRFGLLDDLDLTVRGGFIDGLSGGSDGTAGFEVGTAARFRFLREEDTGVVDVAALGAVSIDKTEHIFLLGLDPQLVISRHFTIAAPRQLYVAAGIGLALTEADVDGQDSDLETGLIGLASAGVDIIEQVRLSLDARLRDEIVRFGLAVTYQF